MSKKIPKVFHMTVVLLNQPSKIASYFGVTIEIAREWRDISFKSEMERLEKEEEQLSGVGDE